MKKYLKGQKGINLITLSITVIIMLIIVNVILYYVQSNLKVEKLKNMQTDIENLRDKISDYYIQYGKIPASIPYTNIEHIRNAGVISEAVDRGNFYVIDLSAIDNLTLNYGEDYERIKSGEATSTQQINALVDLYIINETSHNIFFVKGVILDEETFYTDYTKDDIDTVAVDLIEVDKTKENWTPSYDKTAIYKDANGDTATIPENFQVSRKQGEDVINTGLVVRGPDGSEFVWVPVGDINTMSQCETAGGDCKLILNGEGYLECTTHKETANNIVGKLYATDTGENFGTVNTTYNANSGLREPAILTGNDTGTGTDYDNNTTNDNIVGLTLEGLKKEYKEMAESVAKYGGFYVGRYETSLTSATDTEAGTSGTVQSKAGVIPTSATNHANKMWYGLYDKSKGYTGNKDYLQSSMIWGSQYDAMLNWIRKGNGLDKDKITTVDIGKNSSQSVTTTGNSSNSNDCINQIRDLGGNLFEWSLEASNNSGRIYRGGSYYGGIGSPSCRGEGSPNETSATYGSRLTLYIK